MRSPRRIAGRRRGRHQFAGLSVHGDGIPGSRQRALSAVFQHAEPSGGRRQSRGIGRCRGRSALRVRHGGNQHGPADVAARRGSCRAAGRTLWRHALIRGEFVHPPLHRLRFCAADAGGIAAALTTKLLAQRIRQTACRLGGNLNATTCHLPERSLKTLHLRVERQTCNAGRIAESQMNGFGAI